MPRALLGANVQVGGLLGAKVQVGNLRLRLFQRLKWKQKIKMEANYMQQMTMRHMHVLECMHGRGEAAVSRAVG